MIKPKLTPLQIRFIRDVFAESKRQRTAEGFEHVHHGMVMRLAVMFGVSWRAIQQVARYERWDYLRF
jgi:hypothetical protein